MMAIGQAMAGQTGAPAIDDIMVTATSETIDDDGATDLTRQALVDRRIRSIGDLPRHVPNLTATPIGPQGIDQYILRGLYSPAGAATVRVLVDGVPIDVRPSAFVGFAAVEMLDIDSAVVRRGPQGVAGGAGALAGEIRLTSTAPSLTTVEARSLGELTTTRDGGIGALSSASMGGPLIEGTLGMRASVMTRHAAGYVDKVATARTTMRTDIDAADATAARLALLLAPADRWTIGASVFLQRRRNDDLPVFEPERGPLRQALLSAQPGSDDLTLVIANARHVTDATELMLAMSHYARDSRQRTDYSPTFGELVLGGAIPGLLPDIGSNSLFEARQRNWTQELRFTSDPPAGSLRWTLGLFAAQSRMRIAQTVSEPGLPALVRDLFGGDVADLFGLPLRPGSISYAVRETDDEDQVAGYADLAWRPDRRLTIEAGARLAHHRVRILSAAAGPYAGSADFARDGGSESSTMALPRAALRWQVDTANALRLVASRGLRPGGANTAVPDTVCAADLAALGFQSAPASYRADSVWNYELGLARHTGPLSINHSIYRIDWFGAAQQIDLPRCGFGFVANVGRARSSGFETTIRYTPTARFSIGGSIGFADARFRSVTPIGSTASATRTLARVGARLPFVPRWTIATDIAAAQPTRSGTIRTAIIATYASRYVRALSLDAVDDDVAVFRGDPVVRVDALLVHQWRRWSLGLFADNLFDAAPILLRSIDLVPATHSPARATTLRPRTLGVRIEARI